mmetsp:Transcript_4964/g.13776  ORF Transcript_4964/g.13776 Transcript_4964/m.13776 type:complete len:478 (+) Transcript_4964:78-1511(+)
MVSAGVQGMLVVFCATICYGSYFVPAKKYAVHDGLVFQWYQCSGITLAGFFCALVRNNWSYEGEMSSGFYVCPEGLLMGVLFQVANILATRSVKLCGLGVYYTMHQVTNLGLTFVVGIFGPKIGLAATPPGNVWLAFAGFCLVMLGMVPVMYMEKETPVAGDSTGRECTTNGGANEDSLGPLPVRTLAAGGTPPALSSIPNRQSLDNLFQSSSAPAVAAGVEQARVERAPSFTTMPVTAGGNFPFAAPPAAATESNWEFNSRTWDGTVGRLHVPRDGATSLPAMSFLGAAFVVKEESPEDDLTPREGGALEEQLLPTDDSGQWMKGVLLSLVAGALYAAMYVPLLPWKARMKAEHVQVQGFDTFFSMCVGLYMSSTAYLLLGGAFMRYRGHRMEKSVMRPALMSGVIYAGGSFSFLWAMMLLPYAIGYAMGVGGGLAVSLIWSTCVFGEATTPLNRRCVMLSFVGIISGIVLLGLSA